MEKDNFAPIEGEEVLYKYQTEDFKLLHYTPFNDSAVNWDNARTVYMSKSEPITLEQFTEYLPQKDSKKGLSCIRKTVVVSKIKGKLRLAIYSTDRGRGITKKHFRTVRIRNYLTIDLEKGNFYTTTTNFRTRKWTKSVRCNLFDSVSRVEYSIADQNVALEVARVLGLALNQTGRDVEDVLTKWFVEKNGIKLTDNPAFLKHHYPKKPLLKKHKGYLAKAIMDLYKVKSNKIFKLLNDANFSHNNLHTAVFYYKILGVDYFNQLKEEKYHIQDKYNNYGVDFKFLEGNEHLIKKSEIKRIVNLVNSDNRYFTGLLYDHLRYKFDLKNRYDVDVTFTFKDRKTFDDEHYQLSSRLSAYSRHKSVNYFFDEDILPILESSVTIDGSEFQVYVLKNLEDYIDEGSYQRHCVAGYVGNHNTIIVSLRKGEERLTCEYNFTKGTIECRQRRMKFNGNPTPEFEKAFEKCHKNIVRLVESGSLTMPKIEYNGAATQTSYAQVGAYHNEIPFDDLLF